MELLVKEGKEAEHTSYLHAYLYTFDAKRDFRMGLLQLRDIFNFRNQTHYLYPLDLYIIDV